jgi:hypothetical protein
MPDVLDELRDAAGLIVDVRPNSGRPVRDPRRQKDTHQNDNVAAETVLDGRPEHARLARLVPMLPLSVAVSGTSVNSVAASSRAVSVTRREKPAVMVSGFGAAVSEWLY